jgi:hypothetical protein
LAAVDFRNLYTGLPAPFPHSVRCDVVYIERHANQRGHYVTAGTTAELLHFVGHDPSEKPLVPSRMIPADDRRKPLNIRSLFIIYRYEAILQRGKKSDRRTHAVHRGIARPITRPDFVAGRGKHFSQTLDRIS